MKYVNFVHDPEKQYRSTVPAVRPLSIGLQVTELFRAHVCVCVYPYGCFAAPSPSVTHFLLPLLMFCLTYF